MKTNALKTLALLTVVVCLAPLALADNVVITPETLQQWTGNQTSNAQVLSAVAGILGYTPESLYKQNVGGPESGLYATSYATSFFNTPSDPQDATIVYTGGDFINGSSVYLIVKDGNQVPAWYLFNLLNLQHVYVNGVLTASYQWDGKATIQLVGFWPNQGSISHIEIVGTRGTTVPEPGTLTLLGLGLLTGGFAWRRRV